MREVEQELLDLLNVRLITIYQCVENCGSLLATVKIGDPLGEDTVIKVPVSAGSIAGYVGSTQKALLVNNVNDRKELSKAYPRLRYNSNFSEARGWKVKSQIAVPIKDETLLGVLQLVRFEGDPDFTRQDLKRARYSNGLIPTLLVKARRNLLSLPNPHALAIFCRLKIVFSSFALADSILIFSTFLAGVTPCSFLYRR